MTCINCPFYNAAIMVTLSDAAQASQPTIDSNVPYPDISLLPGSVALASPVTVLRVPTQMPTPTLYPPDFQKEMHTYLEGHVLLITCQWLIKIFPSAQSLNSDDDNIVFTRYQALFEALYKQYII
jgi:hypothetical protein